ncbi:MAG: hypothetical protein WDZ40_01405 [Candidatus Spechtbacterales bacterium]
MSFLSELTAKKYWIISAAALVVVGFLVYTFVSFSNREKSEHLSEEKNTETNQNVSEPEVRHVVAGEITEIYGNLIYLKVEDILYELYPQIPRIRLVLTDEDTEFISRAEKNEDFHEIELNDYHRALQEASEEQRENFPEPPSRYHQKTVQINDFQSGEYIIVISEGNILDQARIDAKTIIKEMQIESF